MPFDKFKATHEGLGPFQQAYSLVTGGGGVFGQLGLKHERSLTEKLISQVQDDSELAGLGPLAEAGRRPMTREQHVQFRAGLQQAVLNQQAFTENYAGFKASNADLRAQALTEQSGKKLDLIAQQGEIANRYIMSGDPALRQLGAQQMSKVLDAQDQFQTAQEAARAQVDLATANDRKSAQTRHQTSLNTMVVNPLVEDGANYAGVQAQLSTGKPDELVPNHILGAALEYTNAALRQADDGNWSFRLGPIGISDDALPKLTYSQVRNLVDRQRTGREKYLNGIGQQVAKEAQDEGFAINGTSVDDVVYPLADAARREQEKEFQPPNTGKTLNSDLDKAGRATLDFFGMPEIFKDSRGALYEKIDRGNGRYEWRLKSEPEQQLPVRGVIERRQTND